MSTTLIRRLHLLNTSIIPSAPGAFTVQVFEIDLPAAKALLASSGEVVSHVGHESTASVMSQVLGIPVPLDRTPWSLTPPEERNPAPPIGDGCLLATWPMLALAFQLRGRPPEGTILTADQIEGYGYDLRLIVVRPADVGVLTLPFGEGALRPFESAPRWSAMDETDSRQEHELDERTPNGTLGLLQGRLAVAVQGTDGMGGSTMAAVFIG